MADETLAGMLEKLSERRAALGRMVKEYNRLTMTNENPALTEQVSERIHETETEIEKLFREARPAIDQALRRKQKALRKLHQDRRKCTSDEKHAIDKKIKLKCKAIDKLTSASGMSSRTNVPSNDHQSPQMQGNANSPSNDNESPKMQGPSNDNESQQMQGPSNDNESQQMQGPSNDNESQQMQGPSNDHQSPKMQDPSNDNESQQMQGNANSPLIQHLLQQNEHNHLNTIDDVLIECYLDEGTYWLSPVCVNFTSGEGKTVHVCMSCMFFF
jgi:hypothetical protein